MAATPVFDRLVSDMSLHERREMLSRVQLAAKIDDEPLAQNQPADESNFELLYHRLTFWNKLILLLRVILTGRDRISLLSEVAYGRLGRRIAEQAGIYFATRTLTFLPPFSTELRALQTGLRLFEEPLKRALGQQRREFIVFLAGLEMVDVQETLLSTTDLAKLNDNPLIDDEDTLRRGLELEVEDAYARISEDDRTAMARHMTAIRYLDLLARFPFERLLQALQGREAKFVGASRWIEELTGVLTGFVSPPAARLLEALFLFSSLEDSVEEEEALEESLLASIGRATEVVAQIRDFNARIPLRDIIRFSLQEMSWRPAAVAGGEDWFALFKQFWTERLTERLEERKRERRSKVLLSEAAAFLKLSRLPHLSHYWSESWEGAVAFRYERSLAFVSGFVAQIFMTEIHRTLKIFLIDGRFYKEENRKDLTDCYDRIGRVPESIEELDRTLGADGEQGAAIAEALTEGHTPGVRARRTASAAAAADRRAREIVVEMVATFDLLANLVDGILHGRGDSTFDSVTNFAFIGGRENPRLRASLSRAFTLMERAVEILKGLLAFESEGGT